jgi:hypothetical protein
MKQLARIFQLDPPGVLEQRSWRTLRAFPASQPGVKDGERRAAGILLVFLAAVLWLACTAAVPRQEGYSLAVNKKLGFNNGSQIRGTFQAILSGPTADVSEVRFLIDGQPFAAVFAPPFRAAFQTADYAEGWHVIAAQVIRKDGSMIAVPPLRLNFVSAQVETDFLRNFIFPILGVVFLIVILSTVVNLLVLRRQPDRSLPLGARRSYGLKGGGICPRCHRPFSLHWWSLNLVAGVFDRCDYCGRWGFILRAGAAQLAAAEAAELADAQPDQAVREKSPEEQLKEMLDDSRYHDS